MGEWRFILEYIPTGKDNAIHSETLCKQIGKSADVIKRYIRQARKEGVNILSGANGYWISADKDEIQAFKDSMTRQAITRFSTIRQINHNLNQIDGQMSIDEVANNGKK